MEDAFQFLSGTGVKFKKVENYPSTRKKMSRPTSWSSIRAVARILFEEVGKVRGLWILLKTGIWNDVFCKPKWHPEYFEFRDEEQAKEFKKVFKSMIPIITIFNALKKKYGPQRADEITARMAIPIAIPFIQKTIKSMENISDIDEIREMISNYLGTGLAFEWSEWVSEDKKEVQYKFTKCAYVMILQAYGLKLFGGYMCLADHLIFDCGFPNVIFGRSHTLGVGDTYCNFLLIYRSIFYGIGLTRSV